MSGKIQQRQKARRAALQALYQWQLNHMPLEDLLAEHLAAQNPKKVDQEYFKALVSGVINQLDEIDGLIEPKLDRKKDELEPIELAILRAATFELKDRIDVPYKVSINEACNLAKEFGTVEGYKYINGVLDKLAKEF